MNFCNQGGVEWGEDAKPDSESDKAFVCSRHCGCHHLCHGGIVEKFRMNKHSFATALMTCGFDDLRYFGINKLAFQDGAKLLTELGCLRWAPPVALPALDPLQRLRPRQGLARQQLLNAAEVSFQASLNLQKPFENSLGHIAMIGPIFG